MASTIYCLSLIIFMEASIENNLTRSLVASTAIERANKEGLGICESMKKPKSYSWLWDGKRTKVKSKWLEKTYYPIARKELKKQTMVGRVYFSECKLGKRFPTPNKLIKSGHLCFY